MTKISTFICCLLWILDLEMAVAYWNLVLTGRFKFLDLWNKFLLVSFPSLDNFFLYLTQQTFTDTAFQAIQMLKKKKCFKESAVSLLWKSTAEIP